MGISRLAAARMRARKIMEDVMDLLDIDDPEAVWYAKELLQELTELYRRVPVAVTERGDRLTEEQIQRAREYPVTQLVEFVRGRAHAWCHDDRRPSLYYLKRRNLACCPVCDRVFTSVRVLMERDGKSFREAVLALQ